MGVDTSNLITALIEVDGDITGTVELCFWTVLEADEVADQFYYHLGLTLRNR